MKEILTPVDMRATDLNTRYNHIPTLVLMENAGARIADHIIREYPDKKRVSIYSGSGGNGGDGFVVARHLLNHDYRVRLFLLCRPENIRNEDAATNYKSMRVLSETDSNFTLTVIRDSSDIVPDNSDIIVDAILGTGVNGRLRQPVSSAVDVINNSPAIVISVDVPSGMNPLDGSIADKAVVAHTTITLHRKKTGLKSGVANYTGEVLVADIGIPRVSEQYVGMGDLIRIPTPRADSHKGENGRVLIIGSNDTYVGAVIFAAQAALSRGVDLVYIVAPESSATIIKEYNPEFIVKTVSGRSLSMEAYDVVEELLGIVDSVLIGPGAGLDEATGELFNRILRESQKTVVVDADALKLVDRKLFNENVILTPHEHEFTQVFEMEVPKRLEEKVELLTGLSDEYSCTILLKGVVDVIASRGECKLNRTGNQGMTIGGTGDLLAGLCLGLTTRCSCFESAYISSFILGSAADEVLKEKGLNYRIKDMVEKLED